ncbi:MAG TPA: MASE1 domain-containing protein [Longimicrobiales bacterium]|nr:MASE1 domain-containing protein [Longimicrobiales bacterium]
MKRLKHRPVLTNVVLGVAYAGIGYATLALGELGGEELRRVVWLASGMALTVGLLVPFRVWPGVMLGGMAATALEGSPPLHVLATGLANGFEIGWAVLLLRRHDFRPSLQRVRDVVLLVFVAATAITLVSASVSVISLVATGGAPPSAFLRIWLMWWLTHAMGMMVVVPPVLTLRESWGDIDWSRLARPTLVFLVVALAAWIPFTARPGSVLSELVFLPFPLLIWAAVRLGMGGAVLATVPVTVAALTAALRSDGLFMGSSENEALFLTWAYTSVAVVSTLIVAALVVERERVRTRLAVGERRLRAVLDGTGDGILVVDGAGVITDVNRALREMVVGEPPHVGEPVQAFLARWGLEEEETEGPVPLREAHPLDAAHVRAKLRADGGRILEAETVPLLRSNGVEGRIWSFHDITRRVADEKERQQLQAQVLHGQKLESLGVLAGGIAHDFNNLLAGILGHADLLRESVSVGDAELRDVDGIVAAVGQAASLCRQMLSYSGKRSYEIGPVDVARCAREIQQLLRVSITRDVELELHLDHTPAIALADETQVRQVLLNLVTNASEAVLAGPGHGAVTLKVERRNVDEEWLARAFLADAASPGEHVIVTVEDPGVGMEPQSIGKIFDPFYSSKGPGRGLGLAATLGVVRSHSGALMVESEPGWGTRFRIALPVARAVPEPAEEPSAPAPSGGDLTVLVVDDEERVRHVVTRVLASSGYRVLSAADGDEALDLLDREGASVDVVLLDLTMPRRGGVATLREMRARGWTMPVLVASGYAEQRTPPGLEVARFVQKPFRADVLRRALAEVVGEAAEAERQVRDS